MPQEPATILVVEDEPALQEAIRLKLQKNGLRVLAAGSGEEALEILASARPALVWLDVLLPGKNGLEVLRTMREDMKLDTPAVMVSVSGSAEKIQQAFNLNVLDYIIKSEYRIDDIVDRVIGYLPHEVHAEQSIR